ncbi:MAG: DUF4358 domain-containing protein [Ruminiclostridium sp.]
MKKIICIALMAAMTAIAVTACGNNGTADTTTTASTTEAATEATTTEATTTEATTEGTTDTSVSEEAPDTSSTTDVVIAKIREAYGENYLPNMLVPGDMIEDMFGLTADMYNAITAETPMISTHVDTVIVVEAKEGQADAVESALNAYRDSKVNDEMQYPMNVAKVNASRVVRNGNFVAFILAGAYDDRQDATDEERAVFAEEQTQIGVDAFNSCF